MRQRWVCIPLKIRTRLMVSFLAFLVSCSRLDQNAACKCKGELVFCTLRGDSDGILDRSGMGTKFKKPPTLASVPKSSVMNLCSPVAASERGVSYRRSSPWHADGFDVLI